MIDAKVLEGVKNWLSIYGRLTCGILAEKMNMPPSSMVYFLRDAVDAGVPVSYTHLTLPTKA